MTTQKRLHLNKRNDLQVLLESSQSDVILEQETRDSVGKINDKLAIKLTRVKFSHWSLCTEIARETRTAESL